MDSGVGEWKRTRYSTDVTDKDKNVVLMGNVHDLRDLGSLKFVLLRDSKGTIQLTAKESVINADVFKKICELGKEDVVLVTGVVKKNEKAPGGREIIPKEIKILVKSESPLPTEISGKITSKLDTRLNWRSLDLRNPKNHAIFNIQAKIVQGFVDYLLKNGFIQVFTPSIIGAASEGGSEVFPVVYFDKGNAFLRQDPQLHRQLTIAAGYDKIFDIGPSWRAELSHTQRHLCEYHSCAVELAFIKDEYDVMKVEEEMIACCIKKLIKESKGDLDLLGVKLKVPKTPFPVLEFPKVYDVLEKLGRHFEMGEAYDTESERVLGDYAKKKYKSDFLFVNRFPTKSKGGFYIMTVDEEPCYARSVDLVFKGLEQSSGGQREHRYEKLMENVKAKNINPESVKWFTDFFKYGVQPHGGFALGIERFTQQLLDIENIREASLFPRDPDRLLP